MIQILDFVKQVGSLQLENANVVVDATLGNGHDILWIKQVAPNAKVYGFDIQKSAIDNTKKRLSDAEINMRNVQLVHDSHANMERHISEKIDLVLFNFGYLPGGDKTITTKTESSMIAIKTALRMLADKGVAILVMYPGHEEGKNEADAVRDYVTKLAWSSYRVYCYQIMNNTKKPPIAYIIQKSEYYI
ncbi:MAG: tRNA (mnm(5)s(2)U34)-methyltransferase [Culicoidibacterales bacterium]